MDNSEINRVSGRIFKNLLPGNWLDRNQEDQNDYGVDLEIEQIAKGDIPKGRPFKVQLKGVENGSYRKDGALVFGKAFVSKFEYYLSELNIPLIFVVCDVTTKKCFWLPTQGDDRVEKSFKDARDKNQDTFTLSFFPTDEFVQSLDCKEAVSLAVSKMFDILAIRQIERIPAATITGLKPLAGDHLSNWASLSRAASFSAMTAIKDSYKLGKFGDAEDIARKHYLDDYEQIEIRMHTGHWLIKLERQKWGKAKPETPQRAVELQFKFSVEMLKLVRIKKNKCSWSLRSYQKCFWRSAIIAHDSFFLQSLMVAEFIRIGSSPWYSHFTRIQRELYFSRITRCFSSILREINKAIEKRQPTMIPAIWADCAKAMKQLFTAYTVIGKEEEFLSFRNQIDPSFPLAIQLSKYSGDTEEILDVVLNCSVNFLGLSDFGDLDDIEARLAHVFAVLKEQSSDEILQLAAPSINGMADRIKGYKEYENSQSKVSEEEQQAFIKQQIIAQAFSMGIDINSPDSEVAKIVKIGLDDINPARILKDCIHMHVTSESTSPIGQQLGLYTAGTKAIRCLKHGHMRAGLELDVIYKGFKERQPWLGKDSVCCNDCNDKMAHPKDWQWSMKWQTLQQQKLKEPKAP